MFIGVLLVAAFFSAIAMIVGAMLGRQYERSRWHARLLEHSGVLPPQPRYLGDAMKTLRESATADPQQIADALNTIAIEVERIGEGQRFLTKLLADRDATEPRRPSQPSLS